MSGGKSGGAALPAAYGPRAEEEDLDRLEEAEPQAEGRRREREELHLFIGADINAIQTNTAQYISFVMIRIKYNTRESGVRMTSTPTANLHRLLRAEVDAPRRHQQRARHADAEAVGVRRQRLGRRARLDL